MHCIHTPIYHARACAHTTQPYAPHTPHSQVFTRSWHGLACVLCGTDDAETEEDTFSFVEAAADAAYEPVSFHAASEAEAEETAESVTHPTVEQTLSAEADHILESLVSEEEAETA
jgi:hypothetical protein